MTRILLIAACILPLAACNASPSIDAKNASVDEVAAKVRAASGGGNFVRPGEWQSNVTIESFEIPGMPPEAVKRMKSLAAQNKQNDFKTCLTAEDVKQPKGKFFTGNEQCRYDHFTMGGGKIDAAMRCPSGQGMTQVMTMQGTYSPEEYQMRMTMKGEGMSGPVAGMKMQMRVQSKRIGECSAAVAAEDVAKNRGN
ncbi:MAG: DUF3617 domain-containing protein [Sphingomonas sp.]|nr:DUF3617 domain-containing protein [Sphingomonas sp.]